MRNPRNRISEISVICAVHEDMMVRCRAHNATPNLAGGAERTHGLFRCTNGAANTRRCVAFQKISQTLCNIQISISIASAASRTMKSRKSARSELASMVVMEVEVQEDQVVQAALAAEEVAPAVEAIQSIARAEAKVGLQARVGSRSQAAATTSNPVVVGVVTGSTICPLRLSLRSVAVQNQDWGLAAVARAALLSTVKAVLLRPSQPGVRFIDL